MKRQTNNAVNPPQGNISGALISEEEAKNLSSRIFPLGDQWQDICVELEAAGLGIPSKVVRCAIETLAGTEEGRAKLHAYWREWAKEKLAGLNGPRDIFRGHYPHVSAYRSDLMEALRKYVADGRLSSEGPIASPQIEPTLKRYIERLPDNPAAIQLRKEIQEARQQAALALNLPEDPEFAKLSASARYEMLIDRYRASLEPAGFKLDSHRKTGVVFRKITSDERWAFLLADQSKGDVDTGSLSPSFALTLPKKAVVPNAVSLSSVAAFLPDDIVPRFHASCFFAKDSYAQFCLAADSIAFLTKILYVRVDKLLAEK